MSSNNPHLYNQQPNPQSSRPFVPPRPSPNSGYQLMSINQKLVMSPGGTMTYEVTMKIVIKPVEQQRITSPSPTSVPNADANTTATTSGGNNGAVIPRLINLGYASPFGMNGLDDLSMFDGYTDFSGNTGENGKNGA